MPSWIPDLRADAEIVCSGSDRVSILLTTAEPRQLSQLAACLDEDATLKIYGATSASRRASEPPRPLGEPFVMRTRANRGRGRGSPASHFVGKTLDEIEREIIHETIAHCDGSIPRAARMLNLSPSTVYRKLHAWENRPASR